MEDKIKEDIIKIIEDTFVSISAKVDAFLEPNYMYSCIRGEGSNESIFQEKYKITYFPVSITTDIGNMTLNLDSTQLNRLNEAIMYAYQISGFHQGDALSNDKRDEINQKFIQLFGIRNK